MRIAVIATAALAAAVVVPAAPAVTAPLAAPVAVTAPVVAEHVHADGHVHSHAPVKPVVAKAEAQVAVRRSATKPVAVRGSMFRTPEAAMRYLAAAYNRRDLVALKHVTTPDARTELENLRDEATDLKLESCEWDEGIYTCTFSHAFPKAAGRGKAWFRVAPATKPGWYMTVMEGCG